MTRDLGDPIRAIREIAEDIHEKSDIFRDLKVDETAQELRDVGTTIVQDVTLNTKIQPLLMACRHFANDTLDFADLTVGDFIMQNQNGHLSNRCCGTEFDLYIVSWEGDNPDPLGITIGPHTLSALEFGNVYDIHSINVGAYDYLTDEKSRGQALLLVVPKIAID